LAALGYITAAGKTGTGFSHDVRSFYAHGTWWALGDDGSSLDYFLYEYDGTTPASHGDTGGWAKALGPGGAGTVNFDTTDSTSLTFYYDDSDGDGVLHVLRRRATGADLYDKWLYETGTGSWTTTGGVAGESTGLTLTTNAANLAVDTNGVVWIVYNNGTDMLSHYRSSGSWTAGPTIDADGTGTPSMCRWVDGDGDAAMGVAIIATSPTGIRWYSRKDSAALSASWTEEEADSGLSTSYDDHLSVQAHLFSGDTTSTVCISDKDGTGNDIHAFMRRPDGVWVSAFDIFSVDRTRQHTVIDATNEKFYITASFGSGGGLRRIVSDIGSSLSFSGEEVVIDSDAIAAGADSGAPQMPVTSTSDMMLFMAAATGSPWWRLLDVASAGGGLAIPVAAYHYNHHLGSMSN
jgi:hypothetical protein